MVEHASLQLVESGLACFRRRARRLAPGCGGPASKHPATARAIANPAIHNKRLVFCAVLLQRLHVLFQRLFVGLFLALRILLKFAVDFTPIARIARFVWLLFPVGYVSSYEAQPYFTRLSL